jgi:Putative peptidoglycan binding domain
MALFSANIPANQTGGAMTADRTKTDPEPDQAQPGSASPSASPDKADSRDDANYKQSMADLSRRLGERAARQPEVDPGEAKAARRAALEAYDRARNRQLIVGLSLAAAVVVAAGLAYLVPTIGSPVVPSSSIAAAQPEPAPPVEVATAAPAPAPPDSPSPSPAPSSPPPAASVPDTPAAEPAAAQAAPAADSQPAAPAPPQAAAPSPLPPPAGLASTWSAMATRTEPTPATASQQAPAKPAPNPAPLRRDEVREVQARLLSFGFNPGPVDGVLGVMTEEAVMHYQRHRGQVQTGTIDRQLLEQLRQDPAPQVAQRAARPDARATRSPAARRSDPFEPVRAAGNRLGQWLDSLVR